MIEVGPNKFGPPRALVTCDVCGTVEDVRTGLERKNNTWLVNEGQVHKKLVGLGWEIVKGRQLCCTCAAARKEDKMGRNQGAKDFSELTQVIDKAGTPSQASLQGSAAAVETKAELRQPTPAQRRQIFELLEVSYDTAKGRYTGRETDKTVAETIGGGVVPGWVQKIREEFFGPDGGNGEIEEIEKNLIALKSTVNEIKAMQMDLHAEINRLTAQHKDQREFLTKLEAAVQVEQNRIASLRKAIGPKAGG